MSTLVFVGIMLTVLCLGNAVSAVAQRGWTRQGLLDFWKSCAFDAVCTAVLVLVVSLGICIVSAARILILVTPW